MTESIRTTIEGFSLEERRLLLYKLKTLGNENGISSQKKSSKRLVAYISTRDSFQPEALQAYLKDQLPAHMIPSAVQHVDNFPYLPNGKIDKASLRKSGSQVQKAAEEDNKSTSEIEKKLIAIWEDVLAFSPIVTTDNFFEIGGDSILSIQIVAKARKLGIQLSPNQLFENQTIGELALFAKSEDDEVHITSIEGAVALTPIQHWYFEMHKSAPHYWNQIFKINGIQHTNPSELEEVIKEIIKHHDALRLSFKNENTHWAAEVRGSNDIESFHLIDISSINEIDELETRINKELVSIQQATDLSSGGLFKCVYFETSENHNNKVYLVAHHLVTDMISWNIIQSDLKQLISRKLNNNPLELDKKVSTIKKWADQLTALAKSSEITTELPYWESQTCKLQKFPADFQYDQTLYHESAVDSLKWTLDEENTTLLMHNTNELYNTKTDDLLITALAATIGDWAQLKQFCFGMERHGRTADCLTEDASNLVGWFTSYFPVSVMNNSVNDLGEQIKTVKEQLRNVPNNGIGYGILKYLSEDLLANSLQQQPQLVFNYLGNQTKSKDDAGITFTPISEGSRHPSSERSYSIEINSFIIDGKLSLRWSYTNKLYKVSTIEKLADKFGETIKEIIRYCQNKESGEYTPSDFPEANISQEDLDNLLKGM